MNYKYPPIYKYIILLILITTFLRYYQIINKDSFLLIAGIFTYMVFIFDYILIRNHPSLLMDPSNVNNNDNNDNNNNENTTNLNNPNKKIIYIKKEKSKKDKKNKIKLIDATKQSKLNKKLLDNLDDDCDSLDRNFEKELEELNKQAELSTDTDNLTEEIEKELMSLGL